MKNTKYWVLLIIGILILFPKVWSFAWIIVGVCMIIWSVINIVINSITKNNNKDT
jgi:hypothetical protein